MKSVKEKALLALAKQQAETTKIMFEEAVKFAEDAVDEKIEKRDDMCKIAAMTFLYGAAKMAHALEEPEIAKVIIEMGKAVTKGGWAAFKLLAEGNIKDMPDEVKKELLELHDKKTAPIEVTREQAEKMGLTPEVMIKMIEDGAADVVMLDKETGQTLKGKEALAELRKMANKEPDPAELDAIEKAINNTNPHGGSPWKVNTAGSVMLPDDKTVN